MWFSRRRNGRQDLKHYRDWSDEAVFEFLGAAGAAIESMDSPRRDDWALGAAGSALVAAARVDARQDAWVRPEARWPQVPPSEFWAGTVAILGYWMLARHLPSPEVSVPEDILRALDHEFSQIPGVGEYEQRLFRLQLHVARQRGNSGFNLPRSWVTRNVLGRCTGEHEPLVEVFQAMADSEPISDAMYVHLGGGLTSSPGEALKIHAELVLGVDNGVSSAQQVGPALRTLFEILLGLRR